jgi:outer membrane biosynthesis protein TonB
MTLALGSSRSARLRDFLIATALGCAWLPFGSALAQQSPATPASSQVPVGAEPGTSDSAQAGPAKSSEQSTAPAAEAPQPGGISEEEIKKQLVGKVLYLRGGYLDDNLSFNEHGVLSGHSPQGSYTLSGVAIERVHLTKRKVQLEGLRYGLHFLGALPSEDPTTAMDRVLITPKKKVLRISIDRETVVTPKKVKEPKEKGKKKSASAEADSAAEKAIAAQYRPDPTENAADTDIPAAEHASDPGSVTTTTSPAHATALLKDALDRIFSVGFDERMMAAMPDFWKLYYQAVAAKSDYRPKDPSVLRQSAVDKKARLISVFEPASNEFAQAHGVAGLALYHVVIGAEGKPGEIAVARPIGFGLDESAADSIRKAAFEPALKNGHPVPVLLDLIVEFHIYSARTGATSKPAGDSEAGSQAIPTSSEKAPQPVVLPGPYSVHHP